MGTIRSWRRENVVKKEKVEEATDTETKPDKKLRIVVFSDRDRESRIFKQR